MLPGVLKESTGGYAAGMGILAAELLMTAVIVLRTRDGSTYFAPPIQNLG